MVEITAEIVKAYLAEVAKVYKGGEKREHSYRTAFHKFLEAITPEDVEIIQEPHFTKLADGKSIGAPDFLFKKNGSIIGYIETKGLDAPYWHNIEKSQQIKNYLEISDNIIVCNYLEFKLVTADSPVDKVFLSSESALEYGEQPAEKDIKSLQTLFTKFFSRKPQTISTAKQLAVLLANRSKYLRTYLIEELKEQEDKKLGELFALYIAFRNNLNQELTIEDFADTFAQVVAYSLFLAKLNAPPHEKLTMRNVGQYISTSFDLVGELVNFLHILTNPDKQIARNCKWLIEEILGVINNMDSYSIAESLSFNKQAKRRADPYLYFYEDFLTQYDKTSKVDRSPQHHEYRLARAGHSRLQHYIPRH